MVSKNSKEDDAHLVDLVEPDGEAVGRRVDVLGVQLVVGVLHQVHLGVLVLGGAGAGLLVLAVRK